MNDIELTEYIRVIHSAEKRLDNLTADSKEAALFIELSNIEKAANLAQNRLNQLRYGR